MALISPGVEVKIIDQSQYLSGAVGSVPLVVFATAANKTNPTDTGIAPLTTSANAGKLYEVTSQRELVTLYGNPKFYTVNGTPVQGYELNEYGLFAAYSALGVTNRVYCLRADIDLASLQGTETRPTNEPANNTYWLDTATTDWGIYEFDAVTGTFSEQSPIVITEDTDIVDGYPKPSLGAIGSYAVIATEITGVPSASTSNQFFYKNSAADWVVIGSVDWTMSVPALVGTNTPSSLTAGDTFGISIVEGGQTTTTVVTVPVAPNNTVQGVANAINSLGYQNVSANVNSAGKLQLYTFSLCAISAISGTVLDDLGIAAGTHYGPGFVYGTSAEMPLWQSGQTQPRPSGSVWLKMGSAGMGFAPKMSVYNATTNLWVAKTVALGPSDAHVINELDATGGKAIPAGTIYAQYMPQTITGPIYFWKRLTTGQTVVTGTETDPVFDTGPYTITVRVTQPNSSSYTAPVTIVVADNSTASDFVEDWIAAAIPYTEASVTNDGAIQLVHTLGGDIRISDVSTVTGLSNGFLAKAGFVSGTTTGVKTGYVVSRAVTAEQDTTTGSGTGFQINVGIGTSTEYVINSIVAGGANYVVGDTITILGTTLGGDTTANDLVVEVTGVTGGAVTKVVLSNSANNTPPYAYDTLLSNWVDFTYASSDTAPVNPPSENQNWYYSVYDEADIMVNTSTGWKGYRNVDFDSNGFPLPSGSNETDPNGPIISATAPTTQSDETDLVYGDLWIDSSDLENYPLINRWQSVDGTDKWVRIDSTNNTGSNGVVFADARWSGTGAADPVNDPIPTIKSMLTSNYVDLDAPTNTTYPTGILLFNTRRSGYNVKQYKSNVFTIAAYGDQLSAYSSSTAYVVGDRVTYNQKIYVCIKNGTNKLPTDSTYWSLLATSTWSSVSGLMASGAPYMGRKAQRNMVVKALNSVIQTNNAIRDEDNFFNLMATPNYPECQPTMIELNGTRNETCYIVGDTPLRLPESATAIRAWATNAAGAVSTGEDALVGRSPYMGIFYPSGTATDLSGNTVVVPPSYMMLRTFLRNDTIAYPWFAAAGVRRGILDNCKSIGYLDATTNEFVSTKTRIGIRDVCYENQINPLVFFTGNGFLNWGNKNSFDTQSALDRTNVARLVAYIRRQLTIAARPFVFEPNDAITREQISGVVESLMIDLVAKRGIYDYLVVCDESNNTPARIDRNELWIDVAIEPVKAAEFIYIPVRILNTGELGGQ